MIRSLLTALAMLAVLVGCGSDSSSDSASESASQRSADADAGVIAPEEANDLVQNGAVLVDVRNPDEYAGGHVPTAVLMPMQTVPVRIDELRTDTPVYLVCEVGARSYRVGEFLAQQGIPSRNVVGGTSEWRAAGLPVSFD